MTCKECHDSTDEPVVIKVANRSLRVCEPCADLLREQEEIAEQAESALQALVRGRLHG
jgi:ribosome-binding protein aMBF1 (putative translation factor)